ncbi:hypothetical protein RBB77_23290 (plasmid) [Tunturibacter psychrotolerans]|uniref:Uncharacterized protein n=1 Tax=Tunturiibacter psychrotolerans TaxID=3069686 RepID=A0AAU7ZXE4_9BACT
MWIPVWVLIVAPFAVYAAWFFKILRFDLPAENRAAVAKAEQENREIAQHRENQRRGDRILESLVENGAPECLLSLRRTSDRPIAISESRRMNPTETLRSYEQFHEAMKLFDDE